mgnify:CR=1 FL=1
MENETANLIDGAITTEKVMLDVNVENYEDMVKEFMNWDYFFSITQGGVTFKIKPEAVLEFIKNEFEKTLNENK